MNYDIEKRVRTQQKICYKTENGTGIFNVTLDSCVIVKGCMYHVFVNKIVVKKYFRKGKKKINDKVKKKALWNGLNIYFYGI